MRVCLRPTRYDKAITEHVKGGFRAAHVGLSEISREALKATGQARLYRCNLHLLKGIYPPFQPHPSDSHISFHISVDESHQNRILLLQSPFLISYGKAIGDHHPIFLDRDLGSIEKNP